MMGYSGVGHGFDVEVRLGKSRSVWYGGDFWVFGVQIGDVFKLSCDQRGMIGGVV